MALKAAMQPLADKASIFAMIKKRNTYIKYK
jgi:hypothetical protein